MGYNEVVKDVQSVAQLDSREAAENAIRATFQTLKERILGNEASELADQLPEEIGQYLRGSEGSNGDHFKLEEFYRRVAEKGNIEQTQAPQQAKAVFAAVNKTVTPGEFDDVRSNLSDDYDELFAASAQA
jgi:uncharacterized protein (DUF2267 family)